MVYTPGYVYIAGKGWLDPAVVELVDGDTVFEPLEETPEDELSWTPPDPDIVSDAPATDTIPCEPSAP